MSLMGSDSKVICFKIFINWWHQLGSNVANCDAEFCFEMWQLINSHVMFERDQV